MLQSITSACPERSLDDEQIRQLLQTRGLTGSDQESFLIGAATKQRRLCMLKQKCMEMQRTLQYFARCEPCHLEIQLPGEAQEASDEQVLLYVMKPVVKDVIEQLLATSTSSLDWVHHVVHRASLSEDLLTRQLQQEIRAAATQQLQKLEICQRHRLIAELFGLSEDSCQTFVETAMMGGTDAITLGKLIYEHHGRRFLPAHIVESMGDSEAAKSACRMATEICAELASYSECRIPIQLAKNFMLHAQGCHVWGVREEGGSYFFMLKDAADVFRRLLRSMPVGCEVVQAVRCQLMTSSPELDMMMAFEELDKLRVLGIFITHMQREERGIHIVLSVWHDQLPRIPLKDFRPLAMALVTHPHVGFQERAVPVSLSESVFVAASFDEMFADVPESFTRYSVPLQPLEFQSPPSLPSLSNRYMLTANFTRLDEVASL